MFYLRQKGYSKSTNAILVFVCVLVCFFLFYALPKYSKYFEIRNQMYALIESANVYTDVELRDKLLYKIKQLKIPAGEDDIEILRDDDNKITIMLHYKETLRIKTKDKDVDFFTLSFSPKVQGSLE